MKLGCIMVVVLALLYSQVRPGPSTYASSSDGSFLLIKPLADGHTFVAYGTGHRQQDLIASIAKTVVGDDKQLSLAGDAKTGGVRWSYKLSVLRHQGGIRLSGVLASGKVRWVIQDKELQVP